ncbi:MAG: hypothetical protein HY827_06925 [Actinobacteria bacterium]|nr:hypothetical protein [Actinomycetota bacterium]
MTNSSIARRVRRTALATALVGTALLAFSAGPSLGSPPPVFAPAITFETSTTRATAHPDARITIDNTASTSNIGSLSISLPNGFWGSLAAVGDTDDMCQNFTPGSGSGSAGADDCNLTPDSKIGTVTSEATIDQSDAKISGDVYMVKSPDASYAAALGVKVHAKVGGVDLGYVRVIGYAEVRGNGEGLNTTVSDIPSSITDSHGRTVTFHIKKMVVDLKSDLDGPNTPLLTNPSKCGAAGYAATFDTGVSVGSENPVAVADTYTVTGCDTTSYAPSAFTFTNSITTAAAPTGFSTNISFPSGSASSSSIKVKLPTMKISYPAVGDDDDMCPAYVSGVFDSYSCPDAAIVGTAVITTPLMPQPLMGNVYTVIAGASPGLMISVLPNLSPNNPSGVSLWFYGATSPVPIDPQCVLLSCANPPFTVETVFSDLPDAPITSVTLTLDGPGRPKTSSPSTILSGKLLQNPDVANCQANDEALADFTSHSAVSDAPSADPKTNARVDTMSFMGCATDPATIGAPAGGETTYTTPSFAIGATVPALPSYFCGVDNFSGAVSGSTVGGTPCNTVTPYTKPGALSVGTHRVFVGSTYAAVTGGNYVSRGFAVVPPAPAPLGPAPTTSFTTAPPATTDPTPTFSFEANQTVSFQCSFDSGAFLPCDSGSPATSGTYTVASADKLLAGSSHTFRVRAQNAEGTIGNTISSGSFSVVVPFEPTFSVDVSTTQARAHPDLDITIASRSHEDLEDVTLSLPDGFMGGLQGVQNLCPVALAAVGNCTSASQVGTVETEAAVDESIVRLDGQVYLTDPLQFGDPAGISIKVPAVIQDVNLGNVIVPVRMRVRGEMTGIDSLAIGVPNSIDPGTNPNGDTVTEFDMRKLKLKLRTGAGAAQPLLTNPSSCRAAEFAASYKGTGDTTTTTSIPFQSTGCDQLGFGPTFQASFVNDAGSSTPAYHDGVTMTATVNANPGDAGMEGASITLPRPISLDVLKLGPVCEIPQFDDCPANTKVGEATATSPLLPPGEVLSGNVYMLRAIGKSIPRLLVRLRGRVDVDIIGVNEFVGNPRTQILSRFAALPDTPINSFTIRVANFLGVLYPACEAGVANGLSTGHAVTGSLEGYNGSVSSVYQSTQFDCSGLYADSFKFKLAGKRTTLAFSVNRQGDQPKIKKFQVQMPRKLPINARAAKKKLIILADGKRLKSKCFAVTGRSKTTLVVNLCGKKVSTLTFNFKPGTLVANKRLRNVKVKLTATDTANKSHSSTVSLSSKDLVQLGGRSARLGPVN